MMGELMKTLTIIIAVLVVLTVGQALARKLSPMMVEIQAAMEAQMARGPYGSNALYGDGSAGK